MDLAAGARTGSDGGKQRSRAQLALPVHGIPYRVQKISILLHCLPPQAKVDCHRTGLLPRRSLTKPSQNVKAVEVADNLRVTRSSADKHFSIPNSYMLDIPSEVSHDIFDLPRLR